MQELKITAEMTDEEIINGTLAENNIDEIKGSFEFGASSENFVFGGDDFILMDGYFSIKELKLIIEMALRCEKRDKLKEK